eukprot:763929-Hanusia_phi.AAC.15
MLVMLLLLLPFLLLLLLLLPAAVVVVEDDDDDDVHVHVHVDIHVDRGSPALTDNTLSFMNQYVIIHQLVKVVPVYVHPWFLTCSPEKFWDERSDNRVCGERIIK